MAISDLKGSINAKIKTNGSQSITGAVLNEVLNEMVDELDVTSEINNKVDKELGKGLSTNDFTTSEKEKLAGLENYDDAELRGEVESLQTEVDSHDVAIEDLQDNKVDKGDYAPALTAGFADNLVSKDVVVDSEFNLRRSGGGAISDGVARMEVVKGNSVVWNQLYKPLASVIRTQVINGVTFSVYEDGTIEANGTAEGGSAYISLMQYTNLLASHKYILIAVGAPVGKWSNQGFYFTGISGLNTSSMIGAEGYKIFQPSTDGESDLNLTCWKGYSISCKFRPMFVDLTKAFPNDWQNINTIEEFYARKPIVEDEYAYNEGEVIHCNVDAVKSVGRNVWDEEWELGALYGDTDDRIRSSYIKVLPNTQYFFRCSGSGTYFDCYEYDEDKNYVRNTGGIFYNGRYTTSPTAQYLRFALQPEYGNTYNHDICINLSDPDFNGQYEPYKEDVRELPSAIKEVFPNGMMSAGSAHDVAYNDLNKEVGVTEKRIGVVDMGTLDWQYILSGSTINLMYVDIPDIKMGGSVNCARFAASPTTENWSTLVDKGICVHSSRQRVIVKEPGYTDATAFKAAMAGVMLYYELATPIVTEHQEPFNLDYQVTNGGQEQAMATEPTSAFKAEIAYGFNASAKIKENANEIAQLKATIAQLQAALASMVNANVEDYE